MNAPTTNSRPVFGQPPRPSNATVAPTRPSIDFRASIRKGPSEKPPRIVLIGVEGVGKSTAGAGMPSPIFLCAEEGLVGPQFAETPSYSPATWDDALAFLDWLRTEQHEFRSLVVDTLDWLEPLLYRHILQRDSKPGKELTSIEDYGYGKGYVVASEAFRVLLGKLDDLTKRGIAVLVLAHSQIKAFNNPLGDNYDRFEPKVAKQIAGMVKEWADAVLFARFEVFVEKASRVGKAKAFGGQRRVVHTTHSAGWDAKNRYGLPDEMELDMASILEAIRTGNGAGGESPEALTAEIRDLMQQVPEQKHPAIEAAITGANGKAAALAQVLNRVRTTIANLGSN